MKAGSKTIYILMIIIW